MRYVITIGAIVVVLAGTAAAQPAPAAPGVTPPMTAGQRPPQSPELRPGEISEYGGVQAAMGATAVSYALLFLASGDILGDARGPAAAIGAVGTLILPSTGRWYAGSVGLRGMGLRLAGLGSAVLAVDTVAGCATRATESCSTGGALALGIAAVALYVGGTIDDFVMAPRDARDHNARLHQVTLVPLVRPDDHGLGLAVAARF